MRILRHVAPFSAFVRLLTVNRPRLEILGLSVVVPTGYHSLGPYHHELLDN
jgi:hypothetical protein